MVLGRLAVALATGVLLAACVSTNSTILGEAKRREPVEPTGVAIYRSAAQVPSTYREIALIHATADSGFTNESRMYASMRREAASLGANAIVLDGVTDYSSDRQGRAIAIVVEGAPARNSE